MDERHYIVTATFIVTSHGLLSSSDEMRFALNAERALEEAAEDGRLSKSIEAWRDDIYKPQMYAIGKPIASAKLIEVKEYYED